jgi:hypothetical protein
MRKPLRVLAITFLISGVSFLVAEGQWVSIPDTNFGSWLKFRYSFCIQGNNAIGWQMDTTCLDIISEDNVFCSNSNISDLTGIQYFDSLQLLYCGENLLTSLPDLPGSLTSLECEHNHLSTLPSLPNKLTVLNCFDNQLSSLPSLPDSLIYLVSRDNPLGSLPVLPNSLQWLNCINNQLTILPALPNNVCNLFCGFNQFHSLPTLPDSLGSFWCNNNPNLSCLPQLKKVRDFHFDSTRITCLTNYPESNASSVPSLDSIPLCDVFNPNGCDVHWNIRGTTYFDNNSNCIHDGLEYGITNIPVRLFGDILIQQMNTLRLGSYSFDTDSFGTYTISVDTSGFPFVVTCPAGAFDTALITVADSFSYDKNFALECKPGFDLAAWSINGRFRPADIRKVNIHVGGTSNFYGINCSVGISGSVRIAITGCASFISPAPGALTPDNVSGNVLTYNVADFGNVSFDSSFNIMVQTDISAPIGCDICFRVTVSPITGDDVPTNNVQTHCFTVVTSFDPNNKEVYPSAHIDTAQHWLTYTINFQNTGTDTAQHIYVTDTLDSDLDASTFQLLAYSHQPLVQIKENAVRFNFPNINLPDSNTNEPLSHGYVQYKIKLKDNLPIGTQINNTAFIYFDFNSPVVTNTTTNTVAVISSMKEFRISDFGFRIFPNPANDLITISIDENFIGSTATITDITGRKMAAVQLSTVNRQLSTADFASGVYFVTVTDRQGGSTTKKLIIRK